MSGRKQPPNGKAASKATAPRSAAKPAAQRHLARLLASVYDQYQHLDDRSLNQRCRRNFVFHMTDWEGDLAKLAELYRHPERFGKDEAADRVAGFLYHVIPHLRAAGRLLLDFTPEDI